MKLNYSFFFIFLIFTIGCNIPLSSKKVIVEEVEKKIELTFVDKDSLVLNGNEGNWYYKGRLYNGYAVQYYSNDSLKEKTGFLNGKKHSSYKQWFSNGRLKLESNYEQNVLNGNYKSWWNNGTLASKVVFVNGKKQGEELKWFASGILSRKRNLLDGRENGIQKAWLQNGKLYVNYEAKNGRIFGMKRVNSCYQLKNEKIEETKKI